MDTDPFYLFVYISWNRKSVMDRALGNLRLVLNFVLHILFLTAHEHGT